MKKQNTVLVGIKPNIVSNLKSFKQSSDVIKCIASFFGENFIKSSDKYIANHDFVAGLYEENEHQSSCVAHYGDKGWYCFILETELPFSQINEFKTKLRKKLKKFSIKSDHPADNSIHISDSPEEAEREIALIKKYFDKN